ncbi:uncharacterized protein GLRG_07347, partial [Colletotrichum graminicola M1.001]
HPSRESQKKVFSLFFFIYHSQLDVEKHTCVRQYQRPLSERAFHFYFRKWIWNSNGLLTTTTIITTHPHTYTYRPASTQISLAANPGRLLLVFPPLSASGLFRFPYSFALTWSGKVSASRPSLISFAFWSTPSRKHLDHSASFHKNKRVEGGRHPVTETKVSSLGLATAQNPNSQVIGYFFFSLLLLTASTPLGRCPSLLLGAWQR